MVTWPPEFYTALETLERTGDPSAGIEAATTAFRIGLHAEGRLLAQKILEILERERMDRLPHEALATRGEAYVLVGDMEKAREWYGKAVSLCRTDHDSIAAIRKKARLHLQALGLERKTMDDVLTVPRIVAFAGHMVDEPGRAIPRFPPDKVEAVRNEIARRLHILKVGYGFCSAARGSDILFIEELKKCGGRPKVFLPFPRDAFKKTSVGYGWNERFDRAVNDVEVVELSRNVPDDARRPEAYAACNGAIRQEAITKAKSFDEEPILMAVYDGNPGDGSGGTTDAIFGWRRQDHAVEIIDISTV